VIRIVFRDVGGFNPAFRHFIQCRCRCVQSFTRDASAFEKFAGVSDVFVDVLQPTKAEEIMVGSVGVEIVLVKLTNPGVFVDDAFAILEDDVSHSSKLLDFDLVDAVETRRHVGPDGGVVDLRHIGGEVDGGHFRVLCGVGETRWSKVFEFEMSKT